MENVAKFIEEFIWYFKIKAVKNIEFVSNITFFANTAIILTLMNAGVREVD